MVTFVVKFSDKVIDHSEHKETSIHGRYITLEKLRTKFFPKLPFPLLQIGNSVSGEPIHAFSVGNGDKKVLMWSQMHGNESTTTKAVLDMVNFLQSKNGLAKTILQQCTLMIVPILNPDGAKAYTRENMNSVDLNRDA